MQKGLRVITLQGAIEKSPILLSQYWNNEYVGGSNSCRSFTFLKAILDK